jgi:recombination protein RecA
VARAFLKPREEAPPKDEGGGMYFASAKENINFVRTGCTLLDCVLGGGWPIGRISNIVGDKSTGKTLLAMEGMANFSRQYDGRRRYNEIESAFDLDYANQGLGMGINDDEVCIDCDTIEDFYNDFETFLGVDDKPKFYILDSLDALSSKAEQDRKMEDGNYGDGKAKKMSEFFRRKKRDIEKAQCALVIVSQIRDNIGAGMFAKKHTRSGGKALDFYSSLTLWLAYLGKVEQTKNHVKRQVGVNIKAKTEKNKVGLPFRECEFQITFGYGIEDDLASLAWLKEIKATSLVQEGVTTPSGLRDIIIKKWFEIEATFMTPRRKYE